MFTHTVLLLCVAFQCNASPATTASSAATTSTRFKEVTLRCTTVVQTRFGKNGFQNAYRKGNRRDYGKVPSYDTPLWSPVEFGSQVIIEVATRVDTSDDKNNIKYVLHVQNTSPVARSGQLAWFTVGTDGVIPEQPDYLFTVQAQSNQGVQGCAILPLDSAKKHLTYQAF